MSQVNLRQCRLYSDLGLGLQVIHLKSKLPRKGFYEQRHKSRPAGIKEWMKIRSEGYAVNAIVYTIVEAIRLFTVVSVHVILQEPLALIMRAQMAGLNACFVISHDAGIIVSKEFV